MTDRNYQICVFHLCEYKFMFPDPLLKPSGPFTGDLHQFVDFESLYVTRSYRVCDKNIGTYL